MYKAIGKYGEYGGYHIELGEHENVESLTVGVTNRFNAIQPKERILIYVYKDNKLAGRIVDNKDIFDAHPVRPMIYLSNKEFKKWQEKRRLKRNEFL